MAYAFCVGTWNTFAPYTFNRCNNHQTIIPFLKILLVLFFHHSNGLYHSYENRRLILLENRIWGSICDNSAGVVFTFYKLCFRLYRRWQCTFLLPFEWFWNLDVRFNFSNYPWTLAITMSELHHHHQHQHHHCYYYFTNQWIPNVLSLKPFLL